MTHYACILQFWIRIKIANCVYELRSCVKIHFLSSLSFWFAHCLHCFERRSYYCDWRMGLVMWATRSLEPETFQKNMSTSALVLI